MEAGAAAEIYKRAKACGIRYSTCIGDEDSTTIAWAREVAVSLRTKIYFSTNSWNECMTHLILIFNLLSDYDVGKPADFTLVKRGFGGDLYKPTIGDKIVLK